MTNRSDRMSIHQIRVVALPAFRNFSRNPYNALLSRSLQELGAVVGEFTWFFRQMKGVDILHVHWPDVIASSRFGFVSALRSSLFLLQVERLQARGASVVWTVHNSRPHDSPHQWLWGLYWPWFLKRLSGVIFLTETSRLAALAAVPELRSVPYAVIWHGHYRPVLGAMPGRAQARARLDLPMKATILLHFGQIRPYKNVPALLRAFLSLGHANTVLVVAGGIKEGTGLDEEIRHLAGGRPDVRLELRYLPQERLTDYLAAADLIVLPYRDILNSGGLLMALSAGRPVLCPAVGSIPEVAAAVGPGWVRCFADKMGSADLAAAIEQPAPPGEPDLSRCDWDIIARQHLEFYAKVIDARRPVESRFGAETGGAT